MGGDRRQVKANNSVLKTGAYQQIIVAKNVRKTILTKEVQLHVSKEARLNYIVYKSQ